MTIVSGIKENGSGTEQTSSFIQIMWQNGLLIWLAHLLTLSINLEVWPAEFKDHIVTWFEWNEEVCSVRGS